MVEQRQSDTSTGQGPGPVGNTKNCRRQEGSSSRVFGGIAALPTPCFWTLTSKTERIHFCCFQPHSLW